MRRTIVIMRAIIIGIAVPLFFAADAHARQLPPQLEWPEITNVNRPWTRWWWHGSAVDEENLTRSLEAYRRAGLGGVEITPIYGVAGYEHRFIEYLSPQWMGRLEHTLREASRLGLGVDMATGTGWPFGGPTVAADDAARYIVYGTHRLRGGERLRSPVHRMQEPLLRTIGNRTQLGPRTESHPLQHVGREPIDIADLVEPISENEHLQALALDQVRFPKPMSLQTLVAYSDAGDVRILTDLIDRDGLLDWTAPEGDWTLYAVFQGWHGKMVERAAPGAEGWALDHFSQQSVRDYLAHFSDAFADYDVSGLRAFFNDSYEVDDAQGEADWTPALFDAFEARRGYDLRAHLPALFGSGDTAVSRRVLTDYRQTVSDLLLDHFTSQWNDWADGHGAIVRNQAHGSPGNILDLYAASDIPEAEGADILRFKFASSAANVTGKRLASAEAATWLNEHFLSNLGDLKASVDRYLLGGINHIVYHGTAYSPENAKWPGWLFYAAVHLSPTNPLWFDFAALNEYVARAQSILQRGRPDNDVLLYLPIFDRYARRGESLLVHFDGIAPFEGMTVAEDAALLQERGYAFDFTSDRQLQGARTVDGRVRTGGVAYAAVLVPDAELVPLGTLAALFALAEGGATVILHRRLPADVPGLADLDARRVALGDALDRLDFIGTEIASVRSAAIGSGRMLLGDDLEALLRAAAVRRERMVDHGLAVVRRSRDDGTDYLIVNRGPGALDDWVPLATEFRGAALFDPMTGETGVAQLTAADRGETAVHLQLDPSESVIVRGYDSQLHGPAFGYYRPLGAPHTLQGSWRIEFVSGGPVLPDVVQTRRLASWIELGGVAANEFSGTATYTLEFARPDGEAAHWRLDFGVVHESARVRLNGRTLGTLIGPSFELVLPNELLRARNVLEVDVSNLMANRIAGMDRRNEPWKRFYNVNFPPNRRENLGEKGVFDASRWQPHASGLIGPVTLTPLTSF